MTRAMTRRSINRLAMLCASLLLAFRVVSTASADGDDGIVRVKSAVPMAEAITHIKADIAGKGIKFFIEIDQSKLAADAGIKLRPSTLVFGNPLLGTQFITSNPNAGLDWPVRLLRPVRRVNLMNVEFFDVVIIGGVNAGIGVTGPVRRAGMSVAMIESYDLGGTYAVARRRKCW